jgi:hypothetical protein
MSRSRPWRLCGGRSRRPANDGEVTMNDQARVSFAHAMRATAGYARDALSVFLRLAGAWCPIQDRRLGEAFDP